MRWPSRTSVIEVLAGILMLAFILAGGYFESKWIGDPNGSEGVANALIALVVGTVIAAWAIAGAWHRWRERRARRQNDF